MIDPKSPTLTHRLLYVQLETPIPVRRDMFNERCSCGVLFEISDSSRSHSVMGLYEDESSSCCRSQAQVESL